MATTMTYGDYSFIPVPLMNLSIENQKTRDGTVLGQLFRITLDGTVTPLPTGTAGYVNVDSLQDALITSLNTEGQRFHIQCEGSDILDVYPRINSISFEPTSDNWVNKADFTVELEFDHNSRTGTPPFISEASEEWVLEFPEIRSSFVTDLSAVTQQYAGQYYARDAGPFEFRLTHNVSAVGKSHYTGSILSSGGALDKTGWQQARDYVIPRLGQDNTFLEASGVMNLDVTQFQYYDHIRSQSVNELDGSFNVTESWVIINPSGSGVPGTVLEDFNIDVQKGKDSDLTTVLINGTIQGLSTISYGTTTGDFSVTGTKYAAATGAWNTIENRVLSRAQLVSQNISTRPLNSGFLNRTVGYNQPQGIVSYNFEFNDRPTNCISGALTESISVIDNNPTDVFASLAILGRSAGPILQDIGTVTAPTRDVNIEAIMGIPTGCTVANLLSLKPTTQVNALLCDFETDLTGTYSQVFKSQDNERFDIKTGNYSRNVRWQFVDCTGNVVTSLC